MFFPAAALEIGIHPNIAILIIGLPEKIPLRKGVVVMASKRSRIDDWDKSSNDGFHDSSISPVTQLLT
jgi:hypothetical protein